MKFTSTHFFIALIVVLVIGIVAARYFSERAPSQYNELAQCINDADAIFYGAFWCPHCQSQKAAFGSASEFLPYLECSTPDGQGQTQECQDAGIQSYPTWEFSDGTREQGVLQPEELAELTGCPLPENEA